jgi:dienelactone hydrolase
MTIIDNESVEVPTPSGPMRTHIFRPAGEGKFPGIALYSEIFQVNCPIRRTAAALAGHGFLVAATDALERVVSHTGAEVLMVWGRNDPHIPFEARMQVRRALEEGGANHQSFEVNAAHAFMRDEGPRYNPVLAAQSLALIVELFHRRLG